MSGRDGAVMPIEDMMAVLTEAGVDPVREEHVEGHTFKRQIRFEAFGVRYWILWWANMAYLHIGHRRGPHTAFRRVAVDTTWPGCRRGLRFYWADRKGFQWSDRDVWVQIVRPPSAAAPDTEVDDG